MGLFSKSHVELNALLRGSGIAFLFSAIGYVISYSFVFLVGRNFGAEGLGLFTLSQTLLTVCAQVALLGMGVLAMKLMGQSRGSVNKKDSRRIIRQMVLILLVSSSSISGILFGFSGPLSNVFFGSMVGTNFLKLAFFGVFFLGAHLLVVNILLGRSHVLLAHSLKLVGNVVLLSTLLVYIAFGFTVYMVPFWSFLINVYVTGFISIVSLGILFLFLPKITGSSTTHFSLLSMSLPMLVTSFSVLVVRYTDVLMVGSFLTISEVGAYSSALKMATIIPIPLILIGGVVAPRMARMHMEGNTKLLQKELTFVSHIVGFLSIPVFIMCMLFPSEILSLVGEEFAEGKTLLRVLSVGFLVHALSGNNGLYMNMTGKEKVLQKIIGISALVNVFLNCIFIPLFGLVGSAVATTVTLVLWNAWANWHIFREDKIVLFFRISTIKSLFLRNSR